MSVTRSGKPEGSMPQMGQQMPGGMDGSKKKMGAILALIVVIVVLAFAYKSMSKGEMEISSEPMTDEEIAERAESVVEKLGKHMLLPADQEPVIFTISDPDRLRLDQPFFAGAAKGDILVVYPGLAKAIIFSEARDLVVNVGPVTFDQNQAPTGTVRQ